MISKIFICLASNMLLFFYKILLMIWCEYLIVIGIYYFNYSNLIYFSAQFSSSSILLILLFKLSSGCPYLSRSLGISVYRKFQINILFITIHCHVSPSSPIGIPSLFFHHPNLRLGLALLAPLFLLSSKHIIYKSLFQMFIVLPYSTHLINFIL